MPVATQKNWMKSLARLPWWRSEAHFKRRLAESALSSSAIENGSAKSYFNPNHAPAGSLEGGEFAPAGGGEGREIPARSRAADYDQYKAENALRDRAISQHTIDALKAGRSFQVSTRMRSQVYQHPENAKLSASGKLLLQETRGKWVSLTSDQLDSIARQLGLKDVPSKNFSAYSFASTQLDLPPDLQERLRAWVSENIPKEDLSPLEKQDDTFHLTVLYGLRTDDSRDVEAALRGCGAAFLLLGPVQAFTTNPNYDVLYVSLLREVGVTGLRQRLMQHLPWTATQASYIPHVALAYVKKGASARLIGDTSFVGQSAVIDRLRFSSSANVTTWVSLLPTQAPAIESGRERLSLDGEDVHIPTGLTVKKRKQSALVPPPALGMGESSYTNLHWTQDEMACVVRSIVADHPEWTRQEITRELRRRIGVLRADGQRRMHLGADNPGGGNGSEPRSGLGIAEGEANKQMVFTERGYSGFDESEHPRENNGEFAPKGEGKIVTDPVKVQEIKNSIAEGQLTLRTGTFNGRRLSAPELLAVRRQVENDLARIGQSRIQGKHVSPGFVIKDVTPEGYGPKYSKDEEVSSSRSPTPYERKVDFSAIKSELNVLEAQGRERVRAILLGARDKLIALVARKHKDGSLTTSFVNGLEFRGLGQLVPTLREVLRVAFRIGSTHAKQELRKGSPVRARTHVADSGAGDGKGVKLDEASSILAMIRSIVVAHPTWTRDQIRIMILRKLRRARVPSLRGGGGSYGKEKEITQYASGWDESLHPRENNGEFAPKGSGGIDKNKGSTGQGRIFDPERFFDKVGATQYLSVVQNQIDRWTNGADRESLSDIAMSFETFPRVRLASLYQMFIDLGAPGRSFGDFYRNGKIDVFRGGNPSFGAGIANFTISRALAERFAKAEGMLVTARVRVQDLTGYSMHPNGEVFVPEDAVVKLSRQLGFSVKESGISYGRNYQVALTPEGLPPTKALEFFEQKATLWGTDVRDPLLSDVKNALYNAIKTGEAMRDTMSTLESLFLGYVGSEDQLIDGEQLTPYRLETLIRTNATEAFNEGRKSAFQPSVDDGFIVGLQYTAILDQRTTEVCRYLDGKILPPEGIETDELTPPRHFNCFVNPTAKFYTSRGWKTWTDLRVGDSVLTHRSRFRKVTEKMFQPTGRVEVVRVWLAADQPRGGKPFRTFCVTPEHPVLSNGRWIPAGDLREGDTITILGQSCRKCGKPAPWFRQSCSQRCAGSLHEVSAEMKHRLSVDMRRQYIDGRRDRFQTTREANRATRRLVKQGRWVLQNPEIRKLGMIAQTKRNYGKTWLESKLGWALTQAGLTPIKQLAIPRNGCTKQGHPRYVFPDFAFPEQKIAVEADGWRHQIEEGLVADQSRDKELQALGWTVLRFPEVEINANLHACAAQVSRVLANHDGKYSSVTVNVAKVERYFVHAPRYNFAVEEDESYVGPAGVVMHNCRSLLSPILRTEGPVEFITPEEVAHGRELSGVGFSETQSAKTVDVMHSMWNI